MEKECECCHEWWYNSCIKQDLCPNCYYYFKQLKQQLKEKDKEIEKLKAETDRDTWKRACELACETLKQVMGKPLWIGGNIPTPEVKDSDYFYQQAKKKG